MIEPDFMVNAFVERDDLMPAAGGEAFENACAVHARIEDDWKRYSKVKGCRNREVVAPFSIFDAHIHFAVFSSFNTNMQGNSAVYTPLITILSSIKNSQVCANKNPTVLTADIKTVKSECKECIIFNNTGLKYYIQ